MIELHQFVGVVYILVNVDARRVKVGTTTNDPADRLRAVNDMWHGRTGTCQICGGRLVITARGQIPWHVVSGRRCIGGLASPLEKEVALAERYLSSMQRRLGDLSGVEKGSVGRKIKTLERRIATYRRLPGAEGTWQLSAAIYTERAGEVELLSHAILKERLDKTAPFGEVFCCSVSEAKTAIEAAQIQLGLTPAAVNATRG
jgi:hypothetical protein